MSCIEFAGARSPKGYGKIKRQGKTWQAHRWYWTKENGPIPDGMHVLHSCDNPPCVNVDHLFLGTNADNQKDMDAKGRRVPPPNPTGEDHPRSVLTSDMIDEIIVRVGNGESRAAVARSMGVHPSTIERAYNGSTYPERNN